MWLVCCTECFGQRRSWSFGLIWDDDDDEEEREDKEMLSTASCFKSD